MSIKTEQDTARTVDVEQEMALVEKGQQLAGHFPDAEALGRARRILEGTLSPEDARAEVAANNTSPAKTAPRERDRFTATQGTLAHPPCRFAPSSSISSTRSMVGSRR